MVPDGWKRQPLLKVAEVRSGVAKGKKDLKDPVEVPYLRVANVQDGHLDLSEIKTIQIERSKLGRYALKYGDVLMTEGGDFDKLGRGDIWHEQISPCVHQNHVFAVRPDQTKIISYFLSALTGSNYGKTYFLSCAKRSTNLASINSTQLKEFPVLFPPLPEQIKIAQILSTWDKAITTTEQLLSNSQRQKKALMQQLLTGKKRFPGFEGEWGEQILSDLVKISYGKSPKDIFDKNGKYPVVGTGGVTGWSNNVMCDQASVIIGRKGTIDRPRYIEMPFWAIDTTFFCTPKKNCDIKWFSYLISSVDLRRYNEASGVPSLSRGSIGSIKALVPPIAEQQKIATALSAVDLEIETSQQELEHLKQEKKALMQQLLTGKRRVKIEG